MPWPDGTCPCPAILFGCGLFHACNCTFARNGISFRCVGRWETVWGQRMEEISISDKRAALARVLASRNFEKSGRARDLLRYIVEEDIAGHADAIKGFTIAMDVFGKDETFDAVSDPLVRVQAGRLREYLKEYYADEGSSDPLVISVPLGGYRPVYSERMSGGKSGGAATPAPGVPEAAEATQQAATDKPHPSALSQPAPVTMPGEPRAKAGTAASTGGDLNLSNQLRWVWISVGALFLLTIGLLAFFLIGVPEQSGEGEEPTAVRTLSADLQLPVLRVFHEGDSPEVLFSAQQLSEIVSKFDMVTTTAMAPAEEITVEGADWSDMEYAFRLSQLPAASVDGPSQIRFELLHLASLSVLRSETYPANVWASPALTLIAASKLNAVASPGGIIFADMVSRGSQTPVMECLQLVKHYYDRRIEERHRPAYECTLALKDVPFAGGIMLATNGGLAAEAAGKGFVHGDLPQEQDAALAVALERALQGVDLAPSSARAAREVGFVRSWRGELSRMSDWFSRAYELNPYDTSIAASYGYGAVLNGDFEAAVQAFAAATEATTRHPTWWDFYYSVSLLMTDRVEQARMAAEPLAGRDKNLFYAILNAALAFESGNDHLAAKTVRQIQERFPEFAENPEGRFAERNLPQALVDRLVGNLRAIGLERE